MPSPLAAPNLSGLPGICHGFFTREGGASLGIYAGLNCGFGSSDHHAHVAENRARVARSLSTTATTVLTLHQIHSAIAVVVDRDIPRPDLPRADGLVTCTPGLVIGALAADCAPVLFADPSAGVVGAAHAGWRGAVGGILEATVAAMVTQGAHRANIRAAVGPCISQPNYEVGPEFEADLLTRDPANANYFTRPGVESRAHFDLPAFVAARLHATGIGSVARQTPCTYADESKFFSFRRTTHRSEPDYGRQISAIVLC
jgi:polyphenol oxidase